MKNFVITVDTEGDNQWGTWKGEVTTTENARCIPRFQELCEAFGFKPVYLLTFEMALDSQLAIYLKRKMLAGQCEVGMHLHSWSSPPDHRLARYYKGNPYITEYPIEVMREKMDMLTKCISDHLEVCPTSHRAGRWASSPQMFEVLSELGYLVDCSVVSGWDASKLVGQTTAEGFDYRNYLKKAYWVNEQLLEVPMIVNNHHGFSGRTIRQKLGHLLKGKDTWLRPAVSNVSSMKKQLSHGATDYSMFMIHSTELMPGGSPYFCTAEDVEHEYEMMHALFEYAAQTHTGCTLKDYYLIKQNEREASD